MTSKGFFVICDISGYTAFLTQAELEHAEEILNHLLNALVKATVPPLRIVKLEGDAIFSYSPEQDMVKGQTLLEIVESIYGAFRQTQERSRLNTTCTCNACRLIPSLDLKLVVHHGPYVEHSIGGIRDLQGAEVITIHRLLKNDIKEATGYQAYAFFSQAAVDAAGMAELTEGMVKHSEEYEHVGKVPGYVHDLHAVWEQMRAQRRDRLEGKQIMYAASVDLPAPLSVAWDYITLPEHKLRWGKYYGFSVSGKRLGRQGVGTYQHCHHNATSKSDWEITDWRPFEYYTYRYEMIPGVLGAEMHSVTPIPGGVRYTHALNLRPKGGGKVAGLFTAALGRGMVAVFSATLRDATRQLRAVIDEDQAAGKIVAADAFDQSVSAQFLNGDGELALTPIPDSLNFAHDQATDS